MMDGLIELVKMLVLVGGILCITTLILVSLPQSRLRDFLMPIVGWCFALFCGVYVLAPVDIMPEAMLGPFGLIDDFGAAVAGIAAAGAAMRAGKARKNAA